MRYLISVTLFFFLASCATRSIIPGAIANGDPIKIKVESKGPVVSFYDVMVQKNGEEYELTHQENQTSSIYKLPANKIELLSEMEAWLKDLGYITKARYFEITIVSGTKKKMYRVNTDIVHDFLTGLKKK